ncbi:hypothetical protein FXO38_15664 [Capsicum annuum]|nr:hypothetical protein FXO38_15664 [Capsicum annuum]
MTWSRHWLSLGYGIAKMMAWSRHWNGLGSDKDQGKVTENMQTKILVLRHVVATSGQYHEGRFKVKILEPKSFDGARSAKELENFLRDMEYYFSTTRVVEIYKLNITKMYLAGDTKFWWTYQNIDDKSTGRSRIDTWEKLKKEMRDQCLPSKASWIARDYLKRLRQNGSVCDYIKKFSSLMLDIQNMSDQDKLRN